MDMIRTTSDLTFQDFLRYPALRVEEGEFAFVTGRSGAGKSTCLRLLVVLVVMRVCRIDQTRLLVVSSMKMTVQLILAGLILTYIFEHPHPLFVVAYLGAMTGFSIHRVLSKTLYDKKRQIIQL